jgi:hypothetical protein
MKRAAVADSDPAAFERFQQLARRLFAVPKKELDEKLAQYRKTRQKAPRR